MKEESERYIDMFCKMLHSDKLKCTPIRQNILRVFFTNEHISVNKILQKLHDDFNLTTSKQSVYSTLKLLLSYNIISKNTQNDHLFYELTRHSNHFHLLCSICHKYIEFEDKYLIQLSEKLAQENSFKTGKFDVTLYGICQECSKTDSLAN